MKRNLSALQYTHLPYTFVLMPIGGERGFGGRGGGSGFGGRGNFGGRGYGSSQTGGSYQSVPWVIKAVVTDTAMAVAEEIMDRTDLED